MIINYLSSFYLFIRNLIGIFRRILMSVLQRELESEQFEGKKQEYDVSKDLTTQKMS